jgi:Zn-finger nucleic acid-binding protein
MKCASCAAEMESSHLHGHSRERVDIDFCDPCRLVWLDPFERQQLSAHGLLDLCRKLTSKTAYGGVSLQPTLQCPRCAVTLVETHDYVLQSRVKYHRCPDGHGRLLTFTQLLREYGLVREIRARDLGRLPPRVKQFRCDGCGGAVDVTQDLKCSYCALPLAIYDPEALRRALEHARSFGVAQGKPLDGQ